MTPRSRSHRTIAAALAVGILACAAAPAQRPLPVASATLPGSATAAVSPGEPTAGGAVRYGDDPSVELSPIEAAAIAAIRARDASRRPQRRLSGALVLAARALARGAAAGAESIEPPARRAALASGGAYDPAPTALLVRGPPEKLPAAIAQALGDSAGTHVGVGAAEASGGATVLVLLAADRKVRLDPFPREVSTGAAATLSGVLDRGLRHPRVFVTLPSGSVQEAEVGGAGAFRAPIRFPAAGRYVLEVVAEGRGGPEVAALLAVTAGPTQAVREDVSRPPVREDPDSAGAVVAALNALRAAHGLDPLRPSPELSAVARRHSEAMRAAGRIAHILPGSGELPDRLRAAGAPFRRAYENVARGGTALAAHEAAEESPAHRANMLQPAASRVGVGIVRGVLPSGAPAVYLTEIFIEPPYDGADSPLVPSARVREALWRERARLGQSPLTADAALDALAAAAANGMRDRDETDPGDLDGRALQLRRSLAAVDVFVASAPDDAIRSANLGNGRFRRVGVGVSTGDSRRFGAGRLFIAVVYTD